LQKKNKEMKTKIKLLNLDDWTFNEIYHHDETDSFEQIKKDFDLEEIYTHSCNENIKYYHAKNDNKHLIYMVEFLTGYACPYCKQEVK